MAKRKATKKTEQIHLTLSPDQVAAWKAKADELGISLTTWIQLRVSGQLVEKAAA